MKSLAIRTLLSGSVLVSAIALPTAPAAAQGAAPQATSQDDAVAFLLASLHAKGILSDAEYQMAMKRLSPPASPAATPQQAVATAPAQAVAGDQPDNGIRITGSTASGIGLQVGDVSVGLHASVNGFYVHQTNSPDTAEHQVAGGTAAVGQDSGAVRSGFVPGYILLEMATQQRGWDVAAHFGFYPGLNSAAGSPNFVGVPQAFNVGGMDLRQVNMTFGRQGVGQFKIGRDIGLFEQDAAMHDMSLLGVGTAPANPSPTNSTLGRIGSGYIYADFIPQITYTTPTFAGLKLSAGVFQPLETFGLNETNSAPGFQYRLTYDLTRGPFHAQLWSSGLTQKHSMTTGTPGRDYTSRGIDFGGMVSYAGFTLLGNYFTGSGLGIAGLFDAPLSGDFGKRDSHGYYIQGTYRIGRVQLGASYGGSWLDLAGGEDPSNLVNHNTSWIGQARYSLTDWLTLIAEYTAQRSVAHNGNKATSNGVAGGAVLAF